MLLTICNHCGKFLPEGDITYPVTIDEGNGLISHKNVCQLCYCTITENQDSKLLLEQL